MDKDKKGKNSGTNEDVWQADEQRLFRAVFDNTFQLMGVLSPDGSLLDVNKTALDVAGLKKEDVLGKPFWETAWWANNKTGQAQVKAAVEAAAKGEMVRFDAEHIALDGRVLKVDFSLTPVMDKNGVVKLLVPEGRDITERVNAERSLLEREARNRAIVDTAPDGICTVTMDGIIESANVALHKLLKYKQPELVGMPVSKVLENYQGDETHVGDALKTGERKLFGVVRETSAIRSTGEKIPVDVALSLLNLGHLRIFIISIRDTRERKKSQELQSQLAAIVESSDDAILGSDIDGVITAWNPAAERLYGFKSHEALGQKQMLIVPEVRKKEMEALTELLRSGESIGHFETIRLDKDGNMLDVDLTISPIRNQQGEVVGTSTIARDISVRKEAERRISEFYSMVSHELRTPLTSIRASLGLLEGGIAGTLDEEALQLVLIARAESDRLILLINDILDLRKIEAGKLELKLRQVQLSELIDSLIETLRAMADEFDVSLKATYAHDWSFVADRERIIQVIHNLLSNAIKYSYKSGKVDVIVEKKDGDQLRFSVIDKGPGIRADQIHKLFGKFQQLDSSDSRPKGGTGLGLAISKAIVEQHGGKVGVISKPGEGSSFWFEIPMTLDISLSLSAIPATVKRTIEREKPKLSKRERGPGPPTALIVEDDKSTLELLIKQLEILGVVCKFAEDGSTAVEILQKFRPDLLVLDITVPAPNGFALVNILKKSDQHDLPLIVYTSLDLSESDKEQLTLGRSKHLIKSITSQEDFVAAVRELLSGLIKERDKYA